MGMTVSFGCYYPYASKYVHRAESHVEKPKMNSAWHIPLFRNKHNVEASFGKLSQYLENCWSTTTALLLSLLETREGLSSILANLLSCNAILGKLSQCLENCWSIPTALLLSLVGDQIRPQQHFFQICFLMRPLFESCFSTIERRLSFPHCNCQVRKVL